MNYISRLYTLTRLYTLQLIFKFYDLQNNITYCTYKHILGNTQARVAFKNIEKLVLTHQNQSHALPSREHVENIQLTGEKGKCRSSDSSHLLVGRDGWDTGEGTTLSSAVPLKENSPVNNTKCLDLIKGGW